MILVVFIFFIIILLLIYLYRKRQEEQKDDDILFLEKRTVEIKQKKEEQNKKTDKAVNDAGIDKKDIEDSLEKCGFGLNSAGGCSGDLVLDKKTKCCVLKEGTTPSKTEAGIKLAIEMVQEIIIGEVVERLVLVIGPKIVQVMAEGVAKKAAGRAIGRMAAKVALNAAKFAKFTASTAFFRASVAFEVGSMLLDIFDPAGYSLFVPNSETEKIRNALEAKFQESVPRKQWPYIFPISLVFPDEFRLVMGEITSDIFPDALNIVAQTNPELFGEYFLSLIADKTFAKEEEFNKLIEEQVANSFNKNPIERDDKIYKKLRESVKPTYRSWIKKYKSQSSKDRIAVSLSKTGVEQWNKFNELKWRRWNPDKKESPPLFAVYTNTYRSVNRGNPGDKSNPNMIEKRLPEDVALAYPYYPLIAMCEDTKRGTIGKVDKGSVNPYSYGVRFNPKTGVCKFTPAYCRRFQLEYNGSGNTACGYYKGQEFAELIFGQTVTRGVMEGATQVKEFFEKIF